MRDEVIWEKASSERLVIRPIMDSDDDLEHDLHTSIAAAAANVKRRRHRRVQHRRKIDYPVAYSHGCGQSAMPPLWSAITYCCRSNDDRKCGDWLPV